MLWSHYEGPGDEDAERNRKRDLGCEFVLLAERFAYFGVEARPLPAEYDFAVVGRGHRVNFTKAQAELLLKLVESLEPGVHGRPRAWKTGDESWRLGSRSRCRGAAAIADDDRNGKRPRFRC